MLSFFLLDFVRSLGKTPSETDEDESDDETDDDKENDDDELNDKFESLSLNLNPLLFINKPFSSLEIISFVSSERKFCNF